MEIQSEKKNSQTDTVKTAVAVSLTSILANTLLSLFKLLAGFIANSSAMVSDGVHSASDVFSSIIVIIGVRLSAKSSDSSHPYGHERLECVAAIVLAVILLMTGIFIGYDAAVRIHEGKFDEFVEPGVLALAAAVISILVKEAMFWYTRHYAKKINSGAVMADAWHHRSDALSSVGALIGIIGARNGYPVFEPLASLLISVFIIKAAIEIFNDSIRKMTDRSCDEKTEESIRCFVAGQDGIVSIDLLRTRLFGNKIYADIEISIDGNKSLYESHAIAERVHDAVEMQFPQIKHIMIHVNPADVDEK